MARGRRPDPAGVKDQKAAVRSRRTPVAAEETVVLAPGSIDPPSWLTKEGRSIWAKLEPQLRQAKLLTAVDAHTFGRYCNNFARWLKMQRELNKKGETYESESAHGKLRRISPAFAIADRVERQLLAAEDRFGINPQARQAIMIARMHHQLPDLFGALPGDAKKPDAAQPTPAAAPAQPEEVETPIGFLN